MFSSEDIHSRHRAAFRALLPDMLKRIDWPAERLKSFRNYALRLLITKAKLKSPWHSKRLAHIDLDLLSESNLHSIPPMTKAELMANFDEILTDPHLNLARCEKHLQVESVSESYLDNRYRVTISGGSSDICALIVFSRGEMDRLIVASLRFIFRWSQRTGIPKYAPVIAGVTSLNPFFRAQQLIRVFSMPRILSIASPIEEIVGELNRVKPNVLFTYPSILSQLTNEFVKGNLQITPSLIVTGAEPLLPEHQATVTRAWKCTIINWWGSTEVGALAVGSGFDPGMLLLDDYVIVELVDRNGESTMLGKQAEKVYVTPLFRYTLPLIRYELTDQLTLLDTPTSCGSGFRRISNVENRLDDVFRYDCGIEVCPNIFQTILGLESGILDYQVHQTKEGVRILVSTNGFMDRQQLSNSIESNLKQLGLTSAVVTVEKVAQIKRTGAAFKQKRFIPLTEQNKDPPPSQDDL